jgi:hypothetical protein
VEETDGGEVKRKENCGSSREIIQPLCPRRVCFQYQPNGNHSASKSHTSRMKYRRPNPRIQARRRPHKIIPLHWVSHRDLPLNFLHTPQMKPKIKHRERDARRFLHPQQTPKWPFTVILYNFLSALDVLCCDGVHAGVFTVV